MRPDAWRSMAAWTRSRVVASRWVSSPLPEAGVVFPDLRDLPLTVGASSGNRLICEAVIALLSIWSATAFARPPQTDPLPVR